MEELTSAPCSARAKAMAAPMPLDLDEPVTTVMHV